MKTTKENTILEYLSTTLILSYFFIHNILLVLTGIILSIYLINISSINRFIKSINKSTVIRTATKDLYKNNNEAKSKSNLRKSREEDSELTLVESIEELGYIPSVKKNNQRNVA